MDVAQTHLVDGRQVPANELALTHGNLEAIIVAFIMNGIVLPLLDGGVLALGVPLRRCQVD